MKKFLPFALLALMIASSAQAAHVSVLGGLTAARPSSTDPVTSATYTAKLGLTYGVLVDFDFIPFFAIETGLLSVGQRFRKSVAGVESDLKLRSHEIPLLVRFTALPILDVAGGLYFQRYGSSYDSTLVSTGVQTSGSWTGAGYSRGDVGVKLAARLSLPVAPLMSFLVDASYKRGLKNLVENPVGDASFKTSETALLAGLSFGF